MSCFAGPNIVEENLVLHLDAANPKSYSGSGNTWSDLSGNGTNGSLTNNPALVNNNYSVTFDGTGDYLSVAGSSAFDSTGDLTLEAWVYLNGTVTDYGGVISFRSEPGSPGLGLTIRNDGNLEYCIYASSISETYVDTPAPLNQWFHMALVRSGSSANNCSCYLNGTLVGNFTSTQQANRASNVGIIGRYYADGGEQYYLNGYVSNVRYVVGTALYTSNFTPPTSPLAAVTNTVLLTCQSNTLVDNSPNAFTITATGNAVVSETAPSINRAAKSFSFNGTDNYVSLGTPSILNGLQVPLTICAWAKLNIISGNQTLYGAYKTASGGGIYSLIRLDSGTLNYYTSTSGGGYQSNGTFTPSINVWYFYAVVVSGSISSPVVKIFLNENSESFSYSEFTSSPDLTVDFQIGKNESIFNEYWNGNISNVSVYNRALSDAEVLQNYNAFRGRYGF